MYMSLCKTSFALGLRVWRLRRILKGLLRRMVSQLLPPGERAEELTLIRLP
jgi:hypothetical protein